MFLTRNWANLNNEANQNKKVEKLQRIDDGWTGGQTDGIWFGMGLDGRMVVMLFLSRSNGKTCLISEGTITRRVAPDRVFLVQIKRRPSIRSYVRRPSVQNANKRNWTEETNGRNKLKCQSGPVDLGYPLLLRTIWCHFMSNSIHSGCKSSWDLNIHE